MVEQWLESWLSTSDLPFGYKWTAPPSLRFYANRPQPLEVAVGPKSWTSLRQAVILAHRARLAGPPRRFHHPFEVLLKS